MNEFPATPQFYTTREVAKRLRVTPETVQTYLRSGLMRGTKPGRSWLVSAEALAEFLRCAGK